MATAIITPAVARAMGHSMDRAKLKSEQILAVYAKAVELINEKTQWSNGETAILFEGTLRGREARFWIKNESGRLNLTAFREGPKDQLDKRFYSKPLLIGLFKPDQGWTVCANEADYRNWNLTTRRALDKAI